MRRAFNRDESRILTWVTDGTARLWDAATGQELVPAMKSGQSVWSAAFDREEKRILTWSVTARRGCGVWVGSLLAD